MKAVLVPEPNGFSIELIAENEDERKELRQRWVDDTLRCVCCEEWREIALERGEEEVEETDEEET